MATMYAWTNFDVERNEYGQTTNVIHVGDQIDKSKLKVTDQEWDDLVASGAIREEPYPDIPADVPPAQYLSQKVASGEATEEEIALHVENLVNSGTAETDAKRAGFHKAAATEEEAQQMASEQEAAGEAQPSSAGTAGTTPKTSTASSSKSE